MGKIIVIGSQKGGVGKTTTTLNLAYSLREMGKKVLTVDFDSQANLTTCYGIEDTGALEYSIGHLMMAQIEEELPENLEDYIQSREGVDYIPSSIYLSVVDATLYPEAESRVIIGEKVFDQNTQKYSLNLRKVERDKIERLEDCDFVLTDDAGKVITFGYEYKADMSHLEKRLARYMALFTLIKSDEVIKKKYERLKAYYDELVEKHRNSEF